MPEVLECRAELRPGQFLTLLPRLAGGNQASNLAAMPARDEDGVDQRAFANPCS